MEIFARSIAAATEPTSRPLGRLTALVQAQLDQVEQRIVQQAAAFDPAIEGYVSYAIGGRGKRLRPLTTLLAAGATDISIPLQAFCREFDRVPYFIADLVVQFRKLTSPDRVQDVR